MKKMQKAMGASYWLAYLAKKYDFEHCSITCLNHWVEYNNFMFLPREHPESAGQQFEISKASSSCCSDPRSHRLNNTEIKY